MLFPDSNIREYPCPKCLEDLKVELEQQEVMCQYCNICLDVMWDGDYDDTGKPYDCTELVIKK